MSFAGRAASLFPALHLALMAACLVQFVRLAGQPAWAAGWALTFLFTAYGLPVVLYRILQRVAPLREGVSDLSAREHSPWWTSLRLQWLYGSFPALEAALRTVPGLYSAWLRLWGSRIGRGVAWTPRVEILDRGLLDLGDGVLLGHRATIGGHLVTERRGRAVVYVRRVRIGAGTVIGANASIGPGTVIGAGVAIGYGVATSANARIGDGARIGPLAALDAGVTIPAGAEVPNGAMLRRTGTGAVEVRAEAAAVR